MSDPFMPIDLRQINTGASSAKTQTAKNTADLSNANDPSKSTENIAQQDSVELSSKSHLVSSLLSEIASKPEVDQSRVEQIRTSIASGEYTVSADKIASKLLTLDFGHRNLS